MVPETVANTWQYNFCSHLQFTNKQMLIHNSRFSNWHPLRHPFNDSFIAFRPNINDLSSHKMALIPLWLYLMSFLWRVAIWRWWANRYSGHKIYLQSNYELRCSVIDNKRNTIDIHATRTMHTNHMTTIRYGYPLVGWKTAIPQFEGTTWRWGINWNNVT